MTSRDRVLAALERRPVDHVPLLLRFWPMGGKDTIPFDWRNQVRRAEHLAGLGVDDVLLLQPPLGYIEDYRADRLPGVASTVTRVAAAPGESGDLLAKEYRTAAGKLRHEVRLTDDWIYGGDVPLFSDYNVSRAVRHAVVDEADLAVLPSLLGEPSADQIDAFRRDADRLRREARRLGLALDGGWVALGDAATVLCGMERVLYAQVDDPPFVDRLLDTLLAWELRRMDLVLAEGVDMVTHMAWYEGTDFWSPAAWRRFLGPRLRALTAAAHARGARYRYIVTKGIGPLLEDVIANGVDCLMGVDPVQDAVDLADVKRRAGGRICLMGGVNSAVMLSSWSPERIDAAVAEAVRVLAPGGGFILFPVDAVFSDVPWSSVETLVASWRKHRGGG